MAMSGITTSDASLHAYENMKKGNTKCVYVQYKIENSEVVVTDTMDKEDVTKEDGTFDYAKVQTKIASIEGHAYVTFMWSGKSDDGRPIEKVVMVHWAPAKCAIRDKMIYASTYEEFRGRCQGVQAKIRADDKSDLDEAELLSAIKKGA